MFDLKQLVEATADIVKEHVAAETVPLLERIQVLEAAQLQVPEKGDPGEPGRDGRDVSDINVVQRGNLVEFSFVVGDTKSVFEVELPQPTPGEKGDPGEPGPAGPEVDGEQLRELVVGEITLALEKALPEALEALPQPVQGEPGPPGEKGEPGKDGADGRDGKDGADGIGLAGLVINRDGALVATLTNGQLHELGVVVGRDGTDGRDGRDGVDGKDGLPGSDGQDGRDGKDGLDGQDGKSVLPEDFSFELVGRSLRISVADKASEVELPIPVYQGEFDTSKTYVDNDLVKMEGSLWIRSEGEWQLAAVRGEDGDKGDPGEPGKDAYPGQAKGLYDPEGEYRAMDVVSHNGSEWRAKVDNPGPLPGLDWMLSASKGKRGDIGKQGVPGKDGVSPVAQYVRGNTLVTTLSDGTEFASELPILEGDS